MHDRFNPLADRGGVAQIVADHQCSTSLALDLVDESVCRRLVGVVTHGDAGAFSGERSPDSCANATGRTGDERDSVLETKLHSVLHSKLYIDYDYHSLCGVDSTQADGQVSN